ERLRFELTHALARDSKPPPDLVERLWFGAIQAVAVDDHAALTLAQDRNCSRQRLVTERLLDALLRQRPLAGDQVAESSIPPIAERLVETRRSPGPCPHGERLLEPEPCPLGLLRARRLASELRPQRPHCV